MPQSALIALGGMALHVLNRANTPARTFAKEGNCAACEEETENSLKACGF